MTTFQQRGPPEAASCRSLPHWLEMRKMAHLAVTHMDQHRDKVSLTMRLTCILSDPHFWVPLAVLFAGLLFLAWVS
jgi:hypothetical protein